MSPNRCRLAASALAPISYISLVSGLVAVGAGLNLVGQILIVPFALKHRAWDMIALSVFFSTVNVVVLAPHVAELARTSAAASSRVEWVNRPVSAASKLAGVLD